MRAYTKNELEDSYAGHGPMKSWPYFDFKELVSEDCGLHRMDEDFMLRLVSLRHVFGVPLNVTSAFRTIEENERVGGGKHSAHLYGRAVDIAIRGGAAKELIGMALNLGFTGIGISQRKGQPRFIHLDDMGTKLGDDQRLIARPMIWSY